MALCELYPNRILYEQLVPTKAVVNLVLYCNNTVYVSLFWSCGSKHCQNWCFWLCNIAYHNAESSKEPTKMMGSTGDPAQLQRVIVQLPDTGALAITRAECVSTSGMCPVSIYPRNLLSHISARSNQHTLVEGWLANVLLTLRIWS